MVEKKDEKKEVKKAEKSKRKKHIQCILEVKEANTFMFLARDEEKSQQQLLTELVRNFIKCKSGVGATGENKDNKNNEKGEEKHGKTEAFEKRLYN